MAESIENLNGVARRFVPFKLPAEEITPDFVADVNNKLNNIPREILGYKTPFQVFREATYAN